MIVLLLACTGPTPTTPEMPEQPPTQPEPVPAEQPAPEVMPQPEPPEPTEDAEPEGSDDSEGLLAGSACLAAEDCASGVCEGQGCDEASPGICAEATRPCTADARPYCGCDDVTFTSSGTCPGARYAHEGPCDDGADDVVP
ncbi:MAG: hypothetical protein KTR31_13615 [Myxococcales bacterium]|nr:hypothetical protein [Myxococcales bacterium]